MEISEKTKKSNGARTPMLLPATDLVVHEETDDNTDVVIERPHHKSAHPYLFLLFPLSIQIVSIYLWGRLHHLWDPQIWEGIIPLPTLDFVAPGSIGRAVELLFWVNVAVQLRWLHNTATAVFNDKFRFQYFIFGWVFDTLNTPFICWILLILIQSFTITFNNGLHLSLASADITLFSAIAALLGMSVGETQNTLMEISRRIFRRWTSDKNPSERETGE